MKSDKENVMITKDNVMMKRVSIARDMAERARIAVSAPMDTQYRSSLRSGAAEHPLDL